ncbi:MAG TPA: UxaA family hydrolase [Sphaerochaeta sp.]|nr:UxaA family hydrolase [Sphaerochaeta sp.]
MQFLGYKRSEGRSGIRNHVLILPTGCASETARMVASQVQGSVNVIINTGYADVQANTNLTQRVLQEAMRPTKHGAIIMDTPGYDIASITSMVAGGCQLVAFTTGRGTPTGIALAPVIKITANKQTYKQMEDNMDLDVSGIIDGSLSLQQQGADAIFSEMLAVADGKITKAEAFGFSDVCIDHVCRFV